MAKAKTDPDAKKSFSSRPVINPITTQRIKHIQELTAQSSPGAAIDLFVAKYYPAFVASWHDTSPMPEPPVQDELSAARVNPMRRSNPTPPPQDFQFQEPISL